MSGMQSPLRSTKEFEWGEEMMSKGDGSLQEASSALGIRNSAVLTPS